MTSNHVPLTAEQLDALHRDLNPNRVAKRSQAGRNLSYLEAYDVKASLIRVFGYGGFSAECLDAQIIREVQVPMKNGDGTNWDVTARATVRLTIHQTGAVYTESAIASGTVPDYTEAADLAIKSAESDALKRAAVYLGTLFGLSLYNNGTTLDVVRVVTAPGQHEIIELVKIARGGGEKGKEALARLQERVKVHPAAPAPEVHDAPVAESAPVEVPVATVSVSAPPVKKPAARRRTTTTIPDSRISTPTTTADRQAIARQALADAEAKAGLINGVPEHEARLEDA